MVLSRTLSPGRMSLCEISSHLKKLQKLIIFVSHFHLHRVRSSLHWEFYFVRQKAFPQRSLALRDDMSIRNITPLPDLRCRRLTRASSSLTHSLYILPPPYLQSNLQMDFHVSYRRLDFWLMCVSLRGSSADQTLMTLLYGWKMWLTPYRESSWGHTRWPQI